MERKRKSFAGRLTSRLLIWVIIVTLCLSYVILRSEKQATTLFYSEIFHNKMLITNEYIRRVISDVYVAATNNIYYIEHNLDNPDCHKETMERIVKSGTRVRSCGISFIEDYYPEKGHRYCPFAWRNAADPDIIYSQDMGDADLDYLTADWFLEIVNSDSAQWSEPFYDGYDEKTTLSAYEVPIHDETGRVVAVLGADVSLDWLTYKLNETDTTINKSMMIMASIFEMKSNNFIINHDGSYITNPDGKRILEDNFFNHLETIDGMEAEEMINRLKNGIANEDRTLDKLLIDGEECYLFYTPIKYTQWVLVSVVPCRAVDILSQLNAATLLFIFLLAMLLIILVGYYYIKNGIYPLKQLTKVANDIAKGKFDTSMPEMKYKDEISQLRDSIEEMQYRLSNKANHGRES
jgi:HAMP domain-containing protein